uniref:Uncharacterized protein n=1 Tax=Bursaphelenchus xylophilus TaxID=6326 RepID=A0A1I7SEW2_BURXY
MATENFDSFQTPLTVENGGAQLIPPQAQSSQHVLRKCLLHGPLHPLWAFVNPDAEVPIEDPANKQSMPNKDKNR